MDIKEQKQFLEYFVIFAVFLIVFHDVSEVCVSILLHSFIPFILNLY